MRSAAFLLLLAIASCTEREVPPPPTNPTSALWFICDAVDAPLLLVLERDGANVSVAEYDKPNGAIVGRSEYQIGGEEGAAGSIYTTLLQSGAEAGVVRHINPGMLENPGSAYTQAIRSVRLGEREVSCRWQPRTRVLAFTGRRSIVVHEGPDGDLIYTSYDFSSAAQAQAIELSENGRSTTFSAEVRDGAETTTPSSQSFVFGVGGIAYTVLLRSDRTGELQVTGTHTPQPAEPFIAIQRGDGAAAL